MILLGLILFFNISFAHAIEKVSYDKIFLSTWRIQDKALMDSIIVEFMLPQGNYQYIEIIDINNNGPDRFDVLRLTPKGVNLSKKNTNSDGQDGIYQVYALSEIGVPESVKKRMAAWSLGDKADDLTVFGTLDQAKRLHEKKKTSKSSIIVTLMTILSRTYQKNDLKLLLERGKDGSCKFELVGFNEDSSTYSAPWDPDKDMNETLVEEMSANEFMRAFFENLKDQFRSELVVMYHEKVDTVIVNERGKRYNKN